MAEAGPFTTSVRRQHVATFLPCCDTHSADCKGLTMSCSPDCQLIGIKNLSNTKPSPVQSALPVTTGTAGNPQAAQVLKAAKLLSGHCYKHS